MEKARISKLSKIDLELSNIMQRTAPSSFLKFQKPKIDRKKTNPYEVSTQKAHVSQLSDQDLPINLKITNSDDINIFEVPLEDLEDNS